VQVDSTYGLPASVPRTEGGHFDISVASGEHNDVKLPGMLYGTMIAVLPSSSKRGTRAGKPRMQNLHIAHVRRLMPDPNLMQTIALNS